MIIVVILRRGSSSIKGGNESNKYPSGVSVSPTPCDVIVGNTKEQEKGNVIPNNGLFLFLLEYIINTVPTRLLLRLLVLASKVPGQVRENKEEVAKEHRSMMIVDRVCKAIIKSE